MLLDIAMPGRDGVEILVELRERWPALPVVMMSGHGTVETAVRTTKHGAYDFIEKPLSIDKVLLTIQHALEQSRLTRENRALRAQTLRAHEIIGESPEIVDLVKQIDVAAPSNGWVLITGENGTGKELVARQIHARSRRADAPFVEVNCAAIPEELIESELFGHEKGAFTGAVAQKVGKFELAHGGTIFLDEIADMSLMTQAKVLRVLQEQRFSRVGGTETLDVDVRVIAATNKDLEAEIEQGRFREDLYYRLNVIPFHVPPLRERAGDMPMLARDFLGEFCAESGVKAQEDHRARDARAPGAQLARQRARAAQPDGAARDHDAGPVDRPAGSARRRVRTRLGERAPERADARGGAPLVRARVPDRAARRARLEHLAHRRGDRHRAREPLAQDQDATGSRWSKG